MSIPMKLCWDVSTSSCIPFLTPPSIVCRPSVLGGGGGEIPQRMAEHVLL